MGAVVSCIQGVLGSIGACLMAITSTIGAILTSIVSGIVSIFNAIISCLTCGGCSRRRRGALTTHTTGRRRHGLTRTRV
ncbi:hypothetical protein I7I50_03382 [Histoplasma capsulatum G186AR]|uniref:Uncharacterized protein n=1 Tax=Ajellomyces capsulatus TaxID=5037 RepID=A0A8H8CX12_AJECA|nr:hypothetical protein I7I52_04289 [Histoplasma capsulatum]QSS74542.1 hypothetical protein I7I50_03382 [Histoplasma capsulatum G186AR]